MQQNIFKVFFLISLLIFIPLVSADKLIRNGDNNDLLFNLSKSTGDLWISGTYRGTFDLQPDSLSSGIFGGENYTFNNNLNILGDSVELFLGTSSERDRWEMFADNSADTLQILKRGDQMWKFDNEGRMVVGIGNPDEDHKLTVEGAMRINGQIDIAGGCLEGGTTFGIDGSICTQNISFINVSGITVDSISVNGSIVPPDPYDNDFDIGNSTLRWRSGYFGTNLYVNGSSYFDETTLVVDGVNHRVGIGTASPDTNLEVAGDTATLRISDSSASRLPQLEFLRGTGAFGSDTYADFRISDSGGLLKFYVDGTSETTVTGNVLALSHEGLVGINTDTPNNDLQVKTSTNGNGITIQRDTTDANSYADLGFLLTTTDAGTVNTYIRAYRRTAHDDNDMVFHVGGSDTMYLDNSGYVGIGTASPDVTLDVNGRVQVKAEDFEDTILTIDTGNGSNIGDDSVLKFATGGTINWNILNDHSISDSLIFYNSSWSPRLTLETGGYVGIGTNNPEALLEIDQGTFHTQFAGNSVEFSRNSANYITAETAGGTIAFVTNGASPSYANANLVLTGGNSGPSYFNGKVGIGTSSPDTILEVEKASSNIDLTLDALTDGYNSSIYFREQNSNYGARVYYDSYDFRIDMLNNNAGTTALFIERTNNNVGIGTTAPTTQLNVVGGGNFTQNVSIGGMAIKCDSNYCYWD